MMSVQEIMRALPQRYPFIMIDRVLSIEPNKKLIALKNVSFNEPYFVGHFPGHPMMPGVLILEALAQACIILAKHSVEEEAEQNKLQVFAGIDKARFKRVVVPGDQLELHVELIKYRKEIWCMNGKAMVEGQLVCSAELMSAARSL